MKGRIDLSDTDREMLRRDSEWLADFVARHALQPAPLLPHIQYGVDVAVSPVPQSYEDYLRAVRSQEERDRGRFMGTAPAPAEEPLYDARSGQATVLQAPGPAHGILPAAPRSSSSWLVRQWRAEDRDAAGDLMEAHRSHQHAIDTSGPTHWSQGEARMACHVCWTLDVCEDGMMVAACYQHRLAPRTRVFVGTEHPPECPEPHN